jgi:ATP-dependent Clp protease adaptor protein ClpS
MVGPRTLPEVTGQPAGTSALEPRYHLVLLDDNDHTYQYVIELLGAVLGYSAEKSYALACVVDSEGRAIIETAGYEQVLRHQRQIHAYGADPRIPRCKGSMTAVIESAPG